MYKLNTVTYGTASALFHTNITRNRNSIIKSFLENNGIIMKNFYVNNLLTVFQNFDRDFGYLSGNQISYENGLPIFQQS